MPKKTKALKKTDENAPWNRKKNAKRKSIETKPLAKTFLIVCEGQTEKLYFQSFPVVTATVEVVDTKGRTKIQLVEYAENKIENTSNTYDEVWCVFDVDVKRREKEFADFDNAINKANALKYKVAYSNDCFELWFYLHFEFTEQEHLRTFYYKALGKLWNISSAKDIKKLAFSKTIYHQLLNDERANQSKAIKRAEKLYHDKSDLLYHQQNPITTVFQLVEMLNQNLMP